jgi:hypothetical protein
MAKPESLNWPRYAAEHMGHGLLKIPHFGISTSQLTVHDRQSLEGRKTWDMNRTWCLAEALVVD